MTRIDYLMQDKQRVTGNRIKKIAIYYSLSILQMKNELDIGYNILQRIISGKRKLDVETASKIAKRYEVSKDFMFGAFPKNKKEIEILSIELPE